MGANTFISILSLLGILCLIFANEAEVNIGLDGDVTPGSSGDEVVEEKSNSLHGFFHNRMLDITLDLVWIGPYNEHHVIASIPPNSSVGINTFVGHAFFAKDASEDFQGVPNNKLRAYPYLITIPDTTTTEFYFDYIPPAVYAGRDGIHPELQLLPYRSDSMNCRFKCLATACEIFSPGEETSTLIRQGQEITKTAGAGRTFVASEPGNREKEFGRYVLHEDKVKFTLPVQSK
jgi:hypothetical protein